MMQVPLLSNLLSLIGQQKQPQAGGDAGPAFAQMLANVPVPSAPPTGVTAVQTPVAPVIVAAPVIAPTAQEMVLTPLLPEAITLPRNLAKPLAVTGKGVPMPGKIPPELPLIIAARLPGALPTKPLADTPATEPETELPKEQTQPLEFADLILLQGFNGVAAAHPGAAKRPTAAPVERQMAAAAMILPVAQLIARPAKERAPMGIEAASVTPAIPTAPPVIAAIPLARTAHDRAPLTPRTAEPAVFAPAAPLLADPQTAPEPSANAPAFEAPAAPEIELGTVIDLLVETRIQSREGRSEVNVPHPDFGRVTLALSLVGQDRLGIAMPDAPAELRAAVGQAFAAPPRTEPTATAPAADTGFSASSDPRGQDTRRDEPGHGARGDQSRPTTYADHNRQFTTNRDNRREASGRGVLA